MSLFYKENLSEYEIIIFFSTGRCGTTFLSRVLKSNESHICHEFEVPEIGISLNKYLIPHALGEKDLDYYFKRKKIPAIKKLLKEKRKFIDTGHQVIYGQLPYFQKYFKKIKYIRIRRDRYETALSFLTTPEKYDIWNQSNFNGFYRWMLRPDFDIITRKIPILEWNKFNRIQKVLWSIDEVERMWQKYLKHYDFNYFDLAFEQIKNNRLDKLCSFIGATYEIPKEQFQNSSVELGRKKPALEIEEIMQSDRLLKTFYEEHEIEFFE